MTGKLLHINIQYGPSGENNRSAVKTKNSTNSVVTTEL